MSYVGLLEPILNVAQHRGSGEFTSAVELERADPLLMVQVGMKKSDFGKIKNANHNKANSTLVFTNLWDFSCFFSKFVIFCNGSSDGLGDTYCSHDVCKNYSLTPK